MLTPQDRSQLGRRTKALASTISLSHPPAKIPKGPSSPHQTCLHHTNIQCCASVVHPSNRSTSLLLLQGPSHRGPLTAKGAKPTPPTPVHLVDPPQLKSQIPSKQYHKPGSVHVAQTETTPLTVSTAPGRGEDKVHTSLTVAPVVGWEQTLGWTAVPPTNTSYSLQHRGSALKVGATTGTTQNEETEEFSSKETPGSSDS